MKRAIGLPLTKVVSILTGRPRYDDTLATLLSALVACMVNRRLQWNGWPASGVRRTPMLVGTSKAYRQFFFSSILTKVSFR